MMRAGVHAAGAIHVALSSIELSILGLAAFDPDVLPAIRSGTRVNTIDADDSGTLCHTVPLDAWPEALWRALAPIFIGAGVPDPASVDLTALYAPRLLPDPADRSLLISVTPSEFVEGLCATYPDAFACKDRVAARILCLHELEWSHDAIALLTADALSDAGWAAVGSVLPDPDDRWRWSPALRIVSRATRDDDTARRNRAALRVKELHAALHLACEMPCAGDDVEGYHRDLSQTLVVDAIALAMVRDSSNDPADDLEIVRLMLDREHPEWRGVRTVSALAA